jgi:hypothetical protein
MVRNIVESIRSAYPEGSYQIRDGGRIGASKTVASFDVGLAVRDGLLEFAREKSQTLQRLREVLEVFYGVPL